ncbi:hypothetical protein AAFF_G00058210 [Aldrovandia affinis]|uniref:Uncharacterized protein n=1 Tax=Aldrovandia affinis TaxID=143900 RepID=A0AAD7S0A8_9TELE|nr:hypothetical protein AAFF_G00058210 [Aldrovandia affinis]
MIVPRAIRAAGKAVEKRPVGWVLKFSGVGPTSFPPCTAREGPRRAPTGPGSCLRIVGTTLSRLPPPAYLSGPFVVSPGGSRQGFPSPPRLWRQKRACLQSYPGKGNPLMKEALCCPALSTGSGQRFPT